MLNELNGNSITSMEHLVREVKSCKTDFLRFKFNGQAGLATVR